MSPRLCAALFVACVVGSAAVSVFAIYALVVFVLAVAR
jgi:hypothetical protein